MAPWARVGVFSDGLPQPACWAGPQARATASCHLESPQHRVPVLELYTSEGCNSCPPADRWLSDLPRRGVSPDRAVLLAFHVDYWNQLGWPDRFSQAAFSARQRQVAARASSGVVYTPQAVLDGRALNQTYTFDTVERRLSGINSAPAPASISADPTTESGKVQVRAQIRLADARIGLEMPARADAEAWVALFERGLSSRVTRGETPAKCSITTSWCANWWGRSRSGRRPRQDRYQVIALRPDWNVPRLGLAIFVQRRVDGSTLQALSSYPVCGAIGRAVLRSSRPDVPV